MSDGWECPKCGTVMAPWMPSCVNDHKTILTDSTKTVPYYPMSGGTGIAIGRCDVCGGSWQICRGNHTVS